jgi:hypothetical protein
MPKAAVFLVCERVESNNGGISLINLYRQLSAKAYPAPLSAKVFAIIEGCPKNHKIRVNLRYSNGQSKGADTPVTETYVHPDMNAIEYCYNLNLMIGGLGPLFIDLVIDGISIAQTCVEFIPVPTMSP